MKKKLSAYKVHIISVVSVLALVLIAGYFIWASSDEIPKLDFPKAANQGDIEKMLSINSLELSTDNTAPIYKLKTVDIAQDQSNIKKALGIDDNVKFGTIKSPNSASSTEVIGYDKNTGRWIYQTDMAYYTGENVPTKEEAIRIANDFMHTLHIYPVEKLGDPVVVPETTGDGLGQQTVLRWTVYYYPMVENEPVYGVFRISIGVGSDGKIVGVEKLASEYEKVSDVPLFDIEDVRNRFNEKNYMYMGDDMPQKTELLNADVGYYADVESEYIQPVYVLSNADETASIIMEAQDRE